MQVIPSSFRLARNDGKFVVDTPIAYILLLRIIFFPIFVLFTVQKAAKNEEKILLKKIVRMMRNIMMKIMRKIMKIMTI